MTEMTEEKKIKGNVPNLRFPEFEGEYRLYSFKDIFLFSTGKNIKQSEASPNFKTPCVRYGELYHLYNEVINEVINKTNLDKSELTFSKGDEILLPSAGEDPLDIGSASALTIKGVAIGRTINILRPMNPNVYSHIYMSYYINQKLRIKISTIAKGMSISNVYNSDLRTLKVLLPSFSEQNKIASFISLLDLRISTQNKIIKKYESLIPLIKDHLSFGSTIGEKLFNKELYIKKISNWKMTRLSHVLTIPEKIKPTYIDKNKLLTVKLHLKGVAKNDNTETLSIGATNYYISKCSKLVHI
jgi:type I restriction enzyme S subunit